MELTAIRPDYGPFLYLVWVVNDVCNYRCSYCHESIWGGKNRNTEREKIDQYKTFITNLLEEYSNRGYKVFKVFFTGGEPSYWKPLDEIYKFLESESKRTGFEYFIAGINSNMSASFDWWNENVERYQNVSASYHTEYAIDDDFMEKARALQTRCYLNIRIMMNKDRFDQAVAFGERVKSELDNYYLEYVPLFTQLSNEGVPVVYEGMQKEFLDGKPDLYSKKIPYTREFKKITVIGDYSDGTSFPLNPGTTVNQGKNVFTGWTCHTEDCIGILRDGSVVSATCGLPPAQGNVFSGYFFLNNPITCTRKFCHCASDVLIRKEVNN